VLSRPRLLALAIAAVALLAAPVSAGAAIVTNGDFETGSFSGWQLIDTPNGAWFTYTGTTTPISDRAVPAPPQGTHAAVTDQQDVSRQLLYQDITLPPGGSVNQLSLIAYYNAFAPIASPDNLDISGPFSNEQYRIDVMRPSAPIDSVAPGDVLLTVFRSQTGDPETVAPVQRTADLSPYAGQTVRLRLAVATTDDVLNGGADAISVKSNGFTIGGVVLNKKKGTAQLPVTVPDAGTLELSGNGVKATAASATKSVAVSGGTVNLLVKTKGKKKRKLNAKGKAKVNVTVTYTPTGVQPGSQAAKVKLKKKG
jgi:hypothetical protein